MIIGKMLLFNNMEYQPDLREIMRHLPAVNTEKNYWLVRTSSGQNYQAFVENNFIAIGWNEVTFEDLYALHHDPNNQVLFDRIKRKIVIEREDDEESKSRRQTLALRQLLKFAYDIKRGDIVIIPSYSSDNLSFGEVLDTPVYEARGAELISCNFVKRKRIRWIETNRSRHQLDFELYKFIFAHQTINNVTEYAEQINANIYDFYLDENDKATFVLRIRNGHDINAFEMQELYDDILFFIKEFADEEGVNLNEHPVHVKFDLQSPGALVLMGISVFGFIALGAFTLLAGGGADINIEGLGFKFKGKFNANSLLDKISDYLDRKQDRDIERTNRLLKNLRHFEVAPNKEVEQLNEIPPENPDDEPGDEMVD